MDPHETESPARSRVAARCYIVNRPAPSGQSFTYGVRLRYAMVCTACSDVPKNFANLPRLFT